MKFHIFASKETTVSSHSKTLKKVVAPNETLYGAYIEELHDQGYEINDVWTEEPEQRRTNHQHQRTHTRKGGYQR
jgi:CRISPR/Cas system CSM-associated protein Csm4 (group 5 of RAMP superfamily)